MAKQWVKVGDDYQQVDVDDSGKPLTRQAAAATGAPRSAVSAPTPQPDATDAPPAKSKSKSWLGTLVDNADRFTPIGMIRHGLNDTFGYNMQPGDLERDTLSGAVMGLDKRALAGLQAAKDTIMGNGSLSDNYNKSLQQQNQDEVQRDQRTGLPGQVAGLAGTMALPLGGIANKAVRGYEALRDIPVASRIAAGLVGGGAAGAVGGAAEGIAHSPDLTDLPQTGLNALEGGLTGATGGAALGAAAIPVAGLARRVGNYIGERSDKIPFGSARDTIAAGEASVADAIDSSGRSVQSYENEMQGLRDRGINPIMADVSEATAKRLRAVSDMGADIRSARTALAERGAGSGSRMSQAMSDASGVARGGSMQDVQDAIVSGRKAQGATDYAPGGVMESKVPIKVNRQGMINDLGIQPGTPADATFTQHLTKAIDNLRSNPDPTVAKSIDDIYQAQQKGGRGQLPVTMRVMDEVMRNYRDHVSSLFKAGDTGTATAVRSQWDALRQKLYDKVPEYSDILDNQSRQFSQERTIDDARSLAGKMFTKPGDVVDHINRIQHPDDQQMFRTGLVSEAMGKVENGGVGGFMKNFLNGTRDEASPVLKDMWGKIFEGKDAGDTASNIARLRSIINAEKQAATTGARLGGSATSSNLGGMDEAGGAAANAAADMLGAIGGMATGNQGQTVGRVGNLARSAYYATAGREQKLVGRGAAKVLGRPLKEGDIQALMSRVAARNANLGITRATRAAAGAKLASGLVGGAQYSNPEYTGLTGSVSDTGDHTPYKPLTDDEMEALWGPNAKGGQ